MIERLGIFAEHAKSRSGFPGGFPGGIRETKVPRKWLLRWIRVTCVGKIADKDVLWAVMLCTMHNTGLDDEVLALFRDWYEREPARESGYYCLATCLETVKDLEKSPFMRWRVHFRGRRLSTGSGSESGGEGIVGLRPSA